MNPFPETHEDVYSAQNVRWGRPRRRVMFTLVELLVVIAIISILAAFLLPSLRKSMSLARQAQCANNLRGIGYCINSYADDWNGWLPSSTQGGWLWFAAPAIILKYAGGTGSNPSGIVKCPEYKAMKHGGNYGMSENWFEFYTFGKPYRRLSEIRKNSQTAWVMDIFYEGTNVNSAEQYYTGRVWSNQHFRHFNRVSVLFADAHAAAVGYPLPSLPSDVFWRGY